MSLLLQYNSVMYNIVSNVYAFIGLLIEKQTFLFGQIIKNVFKDIAKGIKIILLIFYYNLDSSMCCLKEVLFFSAL